MTDLVTVEEIQILAQQPDDSVLVDEVEVVEVIAVAEQGPRGIQGIPGPAGGATLVTVGAAPISGHTAVALGADGLLIYADCTNPSHLGAVLGVVANAYGAGDPAVVQTSFDLSHAGWAFTPGPVFAGAGGAIVQTLPPGAVFAQVLGYALSATRIHIDVQPPIALT